MALPKLFQRIFWHNNTTPAIQEDNLNAMSKGLSDVDDRVISLAGTIMEDVPQIQEDMEELEADMALIDTKIASATAEANRATTAANNAAASVISAGNKALVSEGWAKGTQNGTAVGSSSPYYHNNAEYFKNQARSFTPQGYQDLVDDVDSLKETLTNFEESITGEVVDSEPYVLRQGLGNLADMALVGGSLAWNQLVQNGNFADTSKWYALNGTISASNNELTFTDSNASQGDALCSNNYLNIISGHKYLLTSEIKLPSANRVIFHLSTNDWSTNIDKAVNVSSSNKTLVSTMFAISNSVSNIRLMMYFFGNTAPSTGAVVKVSNVQFFDLTQMFGSTIADYIYSLEQATAGAGVAWFRKYFPNAYYAYQSGKIENVNVASRKVVGKNGFATNLCPITNNGITVETTANGEIWIHGTPIITTSYVGFNVGDVPKAFIGKQVVLSVNEKVNGIGFSVQDGNLTLTMSETVKSKTAIYAPEASTCMINVRNDVGTIDKIFKVQFELGDTATAYEPHKEYTFPFANKQLRGIPKLVDNKLSYDGDIYTADGTVTRKYGIVDMGTLNWKYNSTNNFFWLDPGVLPNKQLGNLLCARYVYVGAKTDAEMASVADMTLALSAGNNIKVKDTSYSDATTFKTAMSGVYLVYELATPTTESANAYQNPQRAFIDGTEEFVDYGVQSATRDVSIPVGNNTTYQLNETLPPTEDYVDGALKFKAAISALGTDESGRTTASRAYTAGEFFYKDGKMYKVLTSIAQGATFTINTNCQQTTLFAELKALAQ